MVAIKHPLSRAGYMEWGQFTPVYGDRTRAAVHELQKDLKLNPAGYGPRTHQGLLRKHREDHPSEWAWDSFALTVMHEEYVKLHESPEVRIRRGIIQMWRYLYVYRMRMAYSQSRPYKLIKLGDPVPRSYDCSGFVAEGHYAAGARNPNVYQGSRMPWNGEGYTGTLVAGGTRCSRLDLELGDLLFYGFTRHSSPAFPYGSPTHVAGWAGNNMIFTFGSYPLKYTYYNYRSDLNFCMHYNVVP